MGSPTGLLAWLLALMLPAAPALRPPPGDDERWAAVHSARMAGGIAGGRMAAARQFFARMLPARPVSKVRDFIERWTLRARAGEGVKPHKSTGRPPKIDNKLLFTIATVWTQKGVGTGIHHRPYESMDEVSQGAQAGGAPGQQAESVPRAPHTAFSMSHAA